MSQHDVVIVDYGVGNLLSVRRGLEHCGVSATLSSDPAEVLAASKVVLPGVGAFGNAMEALNELKLVSVLQTVAARGTPLLGICLGMQLLFDESEEFGTHRGLGIIPGTVKAIPNVSVEGESLKIPHIGWSALEATTPTAWQGTCLADNRPGEAMYFVHSFMAVPEYPADHLASCHYGGHALTAVVGRGSVMGCQFHPEKSGESGLKILRRFCER